jgi:hypothetical protein
VTDPPTFRVRFVITPDTAIDASRLLQARVRRAYDLAATGGIVLGLGVALLADAWFGTLLVLWGIVVLVMSREKVLARRFVARRGGRAMGGTLELLLGQDGITYRSPGSSGELPWSVLTDVRADDRSVVFVSGRAMSAYAPTAAFETREQCAAAIEFARARIAAARREGSATAR